MKHGVSVTRTYTVEYAHRLQRHSGKCKNLHGHSGRVELTFAAPGMGGLGRSGMVIDFGLIDTIVKDLIETFDHAAILEVTDPLADVVKRMDLKLVTIDRPPTSEVLCSVIASEVSNLLDRVANGLAGADRDKFEHIELVSVKFSETARSCAELT